MITIGQLILITLMLAGIFGWQSETLCQAGDKANLALLVSEAKQHSTALKNTAEELVDIQFGKSWFNHLTTVGSVVSDALFGVSFISNGNQDSRLLGGLGTGLSIASTVTDDVLESLDDRHIRRLLKRQKNLSHALEGTIQKLYVALKDGSPEAKARLIELTDAETVEEIETNLAMEAFVKQQMLKKTEDVNETPLVNTSPPAKAK